MKGSGWSVNWRATLLGVGIGIVTMSSVCAGAAGLMAGGTVGVESMGLFAAGILAVTGLVGGLGAMLSGGGAVDAVLVALGELVVLFGLNLVLCEGRMEGGGVTLLALTGGSGAAVLLRCRSGNGHRRRCKRR